MSFLGRLLLPPQLGAQETPNLGDLVLSFGCAYPANDQQNAGENTVPVVCETTPNETSPNEKTPKFSYDTSTVDGRIHQPVKQLSSW